MKKFVILCTKSMSFAEVTKKGIIWLPSVDDATLLTLFDACLELHSLSEYCTIKEVEFTTTRKVVW